MSRSRRRSFLFDLMTPPGSQQRRFGCCRLKNFVLQVRLTHDSRHDRQTIGALSADAMFKAVLAGPLRHAAGKIHFTTANLPSFISKFDDHAHRTGADDAPFSFCDIRNLHDLAIDQRRDCADSNRVADAIDVPAQRRLPVIDVYGRAKHLEIKTRPPLPPNIDRVALIKVDAPGGSL